jgi:tetratricopeptide (TPR) repeat protein
VSGLRRSCRLVTLGEIMKLIRRSAALAALCGSTLALAGPPAATPAPAAAPAAKAAPSTDYPLSCAAAARPLFNKSFEAGFNARIDEARELLKQVVAADPKCAVAKADLAMMTPGAEGNTMFTEALALTPSPFEKLHIQAMEANRAGDTEKALGFFKQMRDSNPNVLVTYLMISDAASGLHKYDEAMAAAKKATELAPKSGAAWNMLGYANVNLKKTEDAVAAFKKYVEVAPAEANAHDSLADALLRAGQFDEAGASYQKAIDASGGKFYLSWDGVAAVKAIQGDYDAARAALAKYKESALEPMEKLKAARLSAWTWAAQGKLPEAIKAIDAAEKEAVAAKVEAGVHFAQLTRGMFQLQAAKYADALKTFAAQEKANTDALNPGQKRYGAALRLVGQVEAQARSNKVADAEKTLAKLDELFKATPGDPMGADFIAFGKGVIAMAKKDLKGAIASLQSTSEEFDYGKLVLAEVQDLAKDAAGATATRDALLKTGHRDELYWVVHARAAAKNKVPGKKVAADGAKK